MREMTGREDTARGSRICVFDVNETLLDLAALDPLFARAFGEARARREWFAQMLHLACVSTITDDYRDFGTLGGAALAMVAERRRVSLAEDERQAILGGMRRLPAHPDVRLALEELRLAGLRIFALTNSTLVVAEEQLTFAGIRDLFEQVLSADSVQRLMPAAEPYQHAAVRANVPIERIRLIAAHGWDVTGALQAGAAAAFVARPGALLSPLAPQPDIISQDLREVASAIIDREADGGQSHI